MAGIRNGRANGNVMIEFHSFARNIVSVPISTTPFLLNGRKQAGCKVQPLVLTLALYSKEMIMSTALKLSDDLVDSAKPYAAAMHRSVTKQIEYWAKLGKAAEENPDLPVGMILDILVSMEEAKAGMLSEYSFE